MNKADGFLSTPINSNSVSQYNIAGCNSPINKIYRRPGDIADKDNGERIGHLKFNIDNMKRD